LGSSCTLDEARVEDINQVTVEENNLLIHSFTKEEVREAIFQIEHNKAPGPDRFLAKFYQTCWDTIKDNLMAMFVEFHNGNLPLYSLNFRIIILLLKYRKATHIK
jgi:hypothetical protein